MASSSKVKKQYREYMDNFKTQAAGIIGDLSKPGLKKSERIKKASELQALIDQFTDKKEGIHRYEWNLFTHHRTIPYPFSDERVHGF
jgi:hypothetical protein